MKGSKLETLYRSKLTALNDEVCTLDSKVDLWHNRLAHMSGKGLGILAKHGLIPISNSETLDARCSHCLIGKQHRSSFSKGSQRKTRVLEMVYSDVCGPMTTRTLGGCSYFVTFIDDYSRKLWAYLLKTKDQVYIIFKQFHVMVERESGELLKCVRTDNGGEYIGLFDQYCKEHGIRHEQSVPKTPQHNGLAERMNRTIVEKIRCMLSHSNLPRSFWGEALCASIPVINRSPTTILEGQVPEEVWSGKKVSYKHLRVFGCRAFAHIPKDERTKLDNKSRQCVLLSFGDDKFGYKLYDPKTKKITRSRDVIFFEEQTIKDFTSNVEVENGDREIVEYEIDDDVEPPTIDNNTSSGNAPSYTPSNDENQHETGDNEQSHEEGETSIEEPQSNILPSTNLRSSNRTRVPSSKYPPHEYVLLTDNGEPTCYQEAISLDDKEEWIDAMREEMNSLNKSNTFILVD
ncbi:hypothetical protein LIER_40709 [Lithospermum erythrorhizon]|uniref:Integrase catalytic domain-containing protein n=1 Tax=Lithospermum erythrorhizon TaxID=34254 RepID=A0AAV3R1Y6_LITER